ncbi:beta-glucosidase [Rhodobacterales bacterium 52_120_T64]|nr:beta-glucosidase [Rhodobacterales bacterium 52_120_T64]
MLTFKDFPSEFTFGAATSSYQIEGQSFGGAGNTHWDQFAAKHGNVVNGEDGAIACDHYHRYEGDLDLLKGLDAYRFSTNWARILPEGRGPVNQQGLDFYDRLVDATLERGLKPYLTLYHWELPAALADQGGWTNPEIAKWFGDYSDVVLDRIGDRLETVATLNEPWCVAWLSHFLGHHAPGLTDLRAASRAMHHVLLAHAEVMDRMRARGQKELGIVLNFEYAQSLDNTPQNLAATATCDAIFNRWFVEALTHGKYPDEALSGMAPFLPDGWEKDMERIQQPIDWLGVNYYTRQIVSLDPATDWPHYKTAHGELPKTDIGWEVYPQGLGSLLSRIKDEYVGDLPIYVTENGMARNDICANNLVNDPERWDFVQQHMQEIKGAIDRGANIQGYFYWSLLDNYEWAFGYEKRFGLVHVDFATQKRTPKQSYHNFISAFTKT